jgi:hypothetical protein
MPKLLIPVYGQPLTAGPAQETPGITRAHARRHKLTALVAQTNRKLTDLRAPGVLNIDTSHFLRKGRNSVVGLGTHPVKVTESSQYLPDVSFCA